MKIALYKGPVSFWDDPLHWITHWAIKIRSLSPYSHCELEIDGVCYSSSVRDHGVRSKVIDLKSGNWDVYRVDADEEFAIKLFQEHMGNPYDWWGILRFVIPFVPQKKNQYFCSEIVGAAIGVTDPEDLFPSDLLYYVSGLCE